MQVRQEECHIKELETLIQSSDEIGSKRLEEEMQQSEQEYQQALADLNKKHAAALEDKVKKEIEKQHSELMIKLSEREYKMLQEMQIKELKALQQQQQHFQMEMQKLENEFKAKAENFRASQHQQQQKWQTQLEEKDKQHKLEMSHKQKQVDTELENTQNEVRAAMQKQLCKKEEKLIAKDLEIGKLQEEFALQEKYLREELQHVKDMQREVAKDQESELQERGRLTITITKKRKKSPAVCPKSRQTNAGTEDTARRKTCTRKGKNG